MRKKAELRPHYSPSESTTVCVRPLTRSHICTAHNSTLTRIDRNNGRANCIRRKENSFCFIHSTIIWLIDFRATRSIHPTIHHMDKRKKKKTKSYSGCQADLSKLRRFCSRNAIMISFESIFNWCIHIAATATAVADTPSLWHCVQCSPSGLLSSTHTVHIAHEHHQW